MTARTATAEDFHAACLYDIADISLLPPPLEGYALDLSDAAARRMAIGVSLFSVACAVAGLWLAALAS